MNETNANLKKMLQWGIALSAAAAWVAVLILALSGWKKWSVWIIFLVLFIAIVLTVCVLIQRRMLFQPIEELTDVVANWDSTAPEDLEKQIGALPGPLGELGGAFYDQMSEVERRMTDMEETVRTQTTREVRDEIAENICRSLLPRTLKDFPSRSAFEVAGLVQPGQRKYRIFYDYFFIDSALLCVAIGQVEGKGVEASMFLSQAQTLIRGRIRLGRSLEETMNDVNAQLYDYGGQGEVRALVGTLDTAMGNFTFVNSGCCLPQLMRNNERYEKVVSMVSTPLGVNQNVSYRAEEFRLRQGDHIFFYTEGLEMAQDASGTAFGDQALREALNRSRGIKEPKDCLTQIAAEAAAFLPSDDAHAGYGALLLEYRKGEKELAHCRVPGTPDYAGEVLNFLKSRLDDNGIQRKHYARIAVLLDELFALCCQELEEDEEITVECGVAPDAQSVNIWLSGHFHGKDPLMETRTGPLAQSAAFIQEQGDFVSFQPGEETDAVSVICFL